MARKERGSEDVGVSVGWRSTGFDLKLKTRLISAIDSLLGTKIAVGALNAESQILLGRAITDANVKLIASAANNVAKNIEHPELVPQSVAILTKASRKQDNVASTLAFAIEDLQSTDSKISDSNIETLDAQFLSRFETYAEGASSDELREKWGKVLAGELRKPGTFSPRVMRVIDELDPLTAYHFGQLNEFRVANFIPAAFAIPYLDEESANMLVYSNLFESAKSQPIDSYYYIAPHDEAELWVWGNPDPELGILYVRRDSTIFNRGNYAAVLSDAGDQLRLLGYKLTREAMSICSILPSDQFAALHNLANVLQSTMSAGGVILRRFDR